MPEQFTDSAKQALKLARQTAVACHHSYIGSEHLLLGLVKEPRGTAAVILKEFQVEETKLMELIDQLIADQGGVITADREGYTPRAEGILRNAVEEAHLFDAGKAGTEHILMAMLKDVECVATRLLHTLGVNLQNMYRKILDILEGRDYVRLTPHTFHDYLNHHDEGSVFSLPYECNVGEQDELTREQYDEIVALAEWSAEEALVLDEAVSLEDTAYDLIRDAVSDPLTACGILSRLEEKFGIGIGISDYGDHQHVYLYGWKDGGEKIEFNDRRFPSANAAMLAVMRRFTEEIQGLNIE